MATNAAAKQQALQDATPTYRNGRKFLTAICATLVQLSPALEALNRGHLPAFGQNRFTAIWLLASRINDLASGRSWNATCTTHKRSGPKIRSRFHL